MVIGGLQTANNCHKFSGHLPTNLSMFFLKLKPRMKSESATVFTCNPRPCCAGSTMCQKPKDTNTKTHQGDRGGASGQADLRAAPFRLSKLVCVFKLQLPTASGYKAMWTYTHKKDSRNKFSFQRQPDRQLQVE